MCTPLAVAAVTGTRSPESRLSVEVMSRPHSYNEAEMQIPDCE